MLRYIYTEAGKHYFVTGVPYSWIQNAPPGDIIIDPTIATGATQDVWIEDVNNKNGNSAGLLVGKAGNYPKKRTLLQFDLLGAGVPANSTVLSVRLKLNYYNTVSANGATWVNRNIETHRMLVDWKESEATRDNRLSGTAWAAQYGQPGTDYSTTIESSTLFTANTYAGSFQYFDLTALTKKWLDGSAANYGVMLLADNEDVNGYDLRFHSVESAMSLYNQPYLEVEWYQPMRTVYFLKDHLGSIRATVDDAGQVIAYDDYDPWGMIMPGRSMTTQANLPNKFTGKEWDDDFGLKWYHFDWRPYDGEIGRWLGVDLRAAERPGLSPYNYVQSNPLLRVDPDGRIDILSQLRALSSFVANHPQAAMEIGQIFEVGLSAGGQLGASVEVGPIKAELSAHIGGEATMNLAGDKKSSVKAAGVGKIEIAGVAEVGVVSKII